MSVLDMERQFGEIQRKHDYYYAVKLHLDCISLFFLLFFFHLPTKSRFVREKSRKMLYRKIKWK